MSPEEHPFHGLASTTDLETMSADELDALPFGLLELDEYGVVQRINSAEARRTGRAPHEFIGRNFFTEVAPCTDVHEFAGVFRNGVRTGSFQHRFRFTYHLPSGSEDVIIHVACHRSGYGWVLADRAPSRSG